MVADQMKVISRKAGESDIWQWSSKGDGEYSLKKLDDIDFHRGTSVTLHLKAGEDEFLDKFRLRHIAKTYSDHIDFPIEFTSSEGEVEVFK